jgi:N-acetylmuramoyl-L-alanine amidase
VFSITPRAQLIATLLTACFLLAASPSGGEKKISIYSSVATYSLPVAERNGHEYVSLLEVLDPLGRVSAQVSGARLALRFNNIDSEFISGKQHAKIRGRDFQLAAPIIVENSRGLVPLSALPALLPKFLGAPVDFHESARRLFVGEVAIEVQAQFDPANPSRLVFNFSAPVNPTISTEPGKLRMSFLRDPVVAPSGQAPAFENKTITDAAYAENNGSAELTISATAPLMASFSNGAKTITITALPQASSAGGTPSTSNPPTNEAPPTTTTPQQQASAPTQPPPYTPKRMLAVIDPAHGGEERGAALSDTLSEKDITLGFARLLRHELELRGFAVLLLRDGDSTLTLDQRAGATNASHASLFVSLHATSQGAGVAVYTALLPVSTESKPGFQPWNSAQSSSLSSSRAVAAAIFSAFQRIQFPTRSMQASLRPLNNVQMPAVAVELAPGPVGISDLPSASYQQKAAAAVADGVASMRDRLGAQP